jgi:type IV pilus assembly protein PilW
MISNFQQRGLTLIELMVAMVLGLMVTGVIINIFLTTNRNFALDEQTGKMQENARYATRLLQHDVRMAGFWGETQLIDQVHSKVRNCLADASEAALDPESTYVAPASCNGLGS